MLKPLQVPFIEGWERRGGSFPPQPADKHAQTQARLLRPHCLSPQLTRRRSNPQKVNKREIRLCLPRDRDVEETWWPDTTDHRDAQDHRIKEVNYVWSHSRTAKFNVVWPHAQNTRYMKEALVKSNTWQKELKWGCRLPPEFAGAKAPHYVSRVNICWMYWFQ